MNDSTLKLGNHTANKTQADWDVDTITEQIYSDLKGAVKRTTIRDVLKEVIPKYEGARIQTYVPIFIRRDAAKRLKSMRAPYSTRDMARDKADGRDESLTNSDLSQHVIAPI